MHVYTQTQLRIDNCTLIIIKKKKANKKRLKRQKKRKSLFLFLAEKLKNKEDFSALNQQGLLYLDNHLQQTVQKLDFSAT